MFLISRHEDKEDYIIYMKIVFIKCAFSLFLGSDYVERTRNKFEKKQEKQTMEQAGLQSLQGALSLSWR